MMKFKTVYLSVTAVIQLSLSGFGQTMKADIPDLLPASPEVSSFIKSTYGGVNMSTGAITASIPLYTLQVKNISWPISIGYSSQGLKIDETTSRVGYGWVLNAGGVISRNVKDDPDDVSTVLSIPSDLGTANNTNILYAKNVSDETSTYDGQPDEYYFSFNGHSGKFVFDINNNPIITSHSNVKIERSAWHNFVITTTDGVKYFFGNEYERTITHNLNTAAPFKNNMRTAYFLTRVEIPGGDWINFGYGSLNTISRSGITQTYTVSALPVSDFCNLCPPPTSSITSQVNEIQYATRYLVNITTSTGVTVNFSYQTRPDLSGDNRLTGVGVSTESSTLKSYNLSYFDPPGFGGATVPATSPPPVGRFFLTRLTENPIDVSTTKLQHDFEYHDLANHAGTPFSAQQDYFGFYNGNTGNMLVPSAAFPADITVNGNRNPNTELAKKGILTSIKYPTGGREQFFYEANTLPSSYTVSPQPVTINLEGFFQGGLSSYTYSSAVFSVPFNQTILFNMQSMYLGEPSYMPEERIVQFYIKRDGDTIVHQWLNGNASAQLSYQLSSGHSYQLLMRIRQDNKNGGVFNCQYDTSNVTTTYPSNAITGGLRLRKIRYTNTGSDVVRNKFYTYATVANILAAQNGVILSSGSGHTSGYYTSSAYNAIVCTIQGILGEYSICKSNILSSNSTENIFEMDGSHIYYSSIVESDDSTFANGCTEYEYFGYDQASNGEVMRGQTVSSMPKASYGTLNGQLAAVRQYDKNFALKREERTEYDGVSITGRSIYAVDIRKKYEPMLNSAQPEREMDAFDIVRYRIWDRWLRKIYTITKTYENGNLMMDTIAYAYGTADNVLPAEVSKKNSKGVFEKTVQKYPTDLSTAPVFAQMVAANQIEQTPESYYYINNVLQQQKKARFKSWVNGLFVQDTVQLKESPADVLKDKIVFEKYDSSGNILQARKINDVTTSYIWDRKKTYPIAQAINAKSNEIFFDSFEDGLGWEGMQYDAANVHAGKLAGKLVASSSSEVVAHSDRWMNVSLAAPKKFKYSAWVYSTGPWVEVFAIMKTANETGYASFIEGVITSEIGKWVFIEKEFEMPQNITQLKIRIDNNGNGTVYFDDIRLHPSDAQMNSFTYQELVGITSKADVNNRFTFYEYDHLNRLSLIRDNDRNIIKKVCYNYAGQPEECGVFGNAAMSATFTRNNCGTNGTGGTVTYSIPANKYSSLISTADANQLAQNDINANGQNYANANASCTWTNQAQSGSFTRDNCGTGSTGSTVTYTIAANIYSSTTSLAAANQLATNALNAGGQAYANANGTCTTSCNSSNCVGNNKKCVNGVCETGVQIEINCEFDPETNKYKHWFVYMFSDYSWSTYTWYVINPSSCAID